MSAEAVEAVVASTGEGSNKQPCEEEGDELQGRVEIPLPRKILDVETPSATWKRRRHGPGGWRGGERSWKAKQRASRVREAATLGRLATLWRWILADGDGGVGMEVSATAVA